MSTPERRAAAAFAARHGRAPALVMQAPGRVNLIGEHTDYNDGFVLPCAIDFRTAIAAAPRDDGAVHVLALDAGNDAGADATDVFDLAAPIGHADPAHEWADYVRGSASVLASRGHALRGADLAISGDVPQGAGLSS